MVHSRTCSGTELAPRQLIYPIFVAEGNHVRRKSIPCLGNFVVGWWSCSRCNLYEHEYGTVNLFGYSRKKTNWQPNPMTLQVLIQKCIREIKKRSPIYVSTGCRTGSLYDPWPWWSCHRREIVNDETVGVFVKWRFLMLKPGQTGLPPRTWWMASRSHQGCAWWAGFYHVGILAYSAKYASCFYGPFGEPSNPPEERG